MLDEGLSVRCAICGRPGPAWGATTGEPLGEAVPERFRMPFLTDANTSARSWSLPTMLRRRCESDLSPLRRGSPAVIATSSEFLSNFGKAVPPPVRSSGWALTLTFCLSASTVTIDTCPTLASTSAPDPTRGPSAAGTPMTDLGRNKPLMLRAPFLAPRPIFLSINDADDAVDEMDRLSVEPVKPPWPE